MLSLVVWIALGLFVGAFASWFLRADHAGQNPIIYMAASVAGALFGGSLATALSLSGPRVERAFSFQTVLFSLLGAFALLIAVNLARARRPAP